MTEKKVVYQTDNMVIKQLTAPIDFHSRNKITLWKSVGSINCLITDILQNIFFFCSAEESSRG